MNFQMFKLDLEKAEEPEIKLPTSAGSSKQKESSRKTSISALLTIKGFDCVDHNKLGNSSRDGNTRPPDLPPEKSVCRSGRNSENWTWTNRLVPNRERSTSRLYIVTLLFLTYMNNTLYKMPGWTKPKLESRLPGKISVTSDVQMTIPL